MSKPPAARRLRAGSVEEVLALLKEQGSRTTSARRVLLEVLFETDHHLNAEELAAAVQARVPDVHISTVYRNLDDLERLGVVTHTHVGHGPSTYQLAGHGHGHFLCKDCGVTLEAPDELFAGLARTVRSRLGFRIDPHHFAMLGTCRDCAG